MAQEQFISGEFDSLDAAEAAARQIRKTTAGIHRIRILGDRSRRQNSNRDSAFPYYVAATEEYALLGAFALSMQDMYESDKLEPENEQIPEPQLRRTVTLELSCAPQAVSAISAQMVSLGGSYVHTGSRPQTGSRKKPGRT